MALKRQNNLMAAFSMASMTDVIFLLLIFFMVTSTYVFPTALEVNLPKSSQQTTAKPTIRVYLDAEGNVSTVKGDGEPQALPINALSTWLRLSIDDEPEHPAVALYADESVSYGKIVEILNIGSSMDVKIVLATRPIHELQQQPLQLPATAPSDVAPAADEPSTR